MVPERRLGAACHVVVVLAADSVSGHMAAPQLPHSNAAGGKVDFQFTFAATPPPVLEASSLYLPPLAPPTRPASPLPCLAHPQEIDWDSLF